MSIVVIVITAQMLISRSSSSSSNHGLSAGNVPESVGKAKPILFLFQLIVEDITKGECPGSGGGGRGSGELEAAERAGVVGREPGENALRMVEMRARELLGLGVEEKVVLANGTEKDWVRVQHG